MGVDTNDLRILVWFPKDGQTYQLLAATKDLEDPGALFAQLLAVEQGRAASSVVIQQGEAPVDERREAP